MGGTRCRATAALIALLVAVVAVAGGAGAATRQLITGDAKGNAPFVYLDGCSFVHQHYIGTVQRRGGAAVDIDVDLCIDLPSGNPQGFHGHGTCTIVTGTGKVGGTARGVVGIPVGAPFAFDLTVTQTSPSVVAHVGEVLHFTGVWHSNAATGGPFTGRVTDHD
jgi:hypothetical protein